MSTFQRADRRAAVVTWWLGVPAALAALLLAVEYTTDWDRTVSLLAYDPITRGFPLRHTFWLDVVLHHWAKYAVVALGVILVIALLLSFAWPSLRPHRRLLAFLVLSLTLAPLSVTIGKAASARHCPWDVEGLGGQFPYTRLLEVPAAGVAPGRCFPAGHASTGFALMAFYFAAYRLRRPKLARLALAAGIAAGLVLGFGRVLQGAHFVSHVAWSGLLCWLVMVALYALLFRGTSPERPDG